MKEEVGGEWQESLSHGATIIARRAILSFALCQRGKYETVIAQRVRRDIMSASCQLLRNAILSRTCTRTRTYIAPLPAPPP